MKLQPVILSGGSGSRLWPLSRESHPKQLLELIDDRSMLQQTALRMKDADVGIETSAEPIVVCNEAYRFITAEQLRQAGCPSRHLILEPVGRNTAPALTLAALHVVAEASDALLLVMPADHVIGDVSALHAAVRCGVRPAADGAVVIFGTVPDRPETGYGYIRIGERGDAGVHGVGAFVEKPALADAERFVASGEYLWNAGLFLLRASVWLQAMKLLAPRMLEQCEAAWRATARDADFVRVGHDAFAAIEGDSIDYAVMEQLARQPELGIEPRVVPLDAGWSDVGSWDALWALAERDECGNAARGDALFESASDTLVHASGRLVACVGVRDLVVVETPDVVMVADRAHTQQVKHVVARLKQAGRSEVVAHRKVHRPWGFYDSIDGGERFQVKRIVVKPGAALSLQMHHHRAEHWIVVRGTARVTRGDETFLLSENQSTYIPLGVRHRLENPGKVPLEMIEVQSGSYLGEDDIVRFEDSYGRG